MGHNENRQVLSELMRDVESFPYGLDNRPKYILGYENEAIFDDKQGNTIYKVKVYY